MSAYAEELIDEGIDSNREAAEREQTLDGPAIEEQTTPQRQRSQQMDHRSVAALWDRGGPSPPMDRLHGRRCHARPSTARG